MKVTTERVQAKAKERGGELLATVAGTGYKVKYPFRCAAGHVWLSNVSNILNGKWCLACAGRARLSLASLQEAARSRGGKCLSNSYSNCDSHYVWQCSEGHSWEASATNVLHGKTWCPQCGSNRPLSIEILQDAAAQKGGKLLDVEYRGILKPYRWECIRGHRWTTLASNVVHNNHWCRRCRGKESSGEIALFNALLLQYPDAQRNVRGLLPLRRRLEVDIWIPSQSTAIEYDGHYWHQDPLVIERDRYKDATLPTLGIALIRVDDSDFRSDPAAVTAKVLAQLGATRSSTN